MQRVAIVVVILIAVAIAAFGPGLSFGAGDVAKDFQLYSTRSKLFQLSELRGKVVVLDFWASWCPPCRAAIPAMQRLHERYSDQGLVVLGINVNDNKDPAEFMASMHATYPVLVSGDAVSQMYQVKGIPTLIVIDADGHIVYREAGWSSAAEKKMQEVIEKALEGARP